MEWLFQQLIDQVREDVRTANELSARQCLGKRFEFSSGGSFITVGRTIEGPPST
jgi:hypothetical protein